MKSKIRAAAVAFGVLSIGYYLYYGLTYTPDEFTGGMLGWVGPQMALPILALTIVTIVFACTGDGIIEAFTGRNSGEFRAGELGIGTITAFRQTGVSVNDQPQVRIDFRVEGADGKVFDSQATMIVPLTELALLQPGVVLPVRYLPGRTDKVEVDRSGDAGAAQRAMNESLIRKGITTRGKLDIAERGLCAQAVVRSLDVSGRIRGGYTEVTLGLVVTRPDASTFQTRVGKYLPPSAIGHVQIGRVIQVRYLPGNEQEVVIALPVNAG
ncbi:hypothetical protein BOX37_31735 [Nocardia mangyaensis]|uniref:Uncharacterized protein n=1 Tax=Nocardia mangyaensis TaxID=2213200 RepID=A0A1J0W0F4_9NOCA|nr:hypothetical protein [Nocardia mangyaensis]APE37754.1 hypothetical protein BOX37_31735 [Nocardia mangyaensis]